MAAGLIYPITVQDRASAAFEKIANATQSAAGAAERLDEVWADLSRAEQKAAATGLRHVAAIEDVNKAMAETAEMSTAVQKATLGVIAAQDRLSEAMESGRATTASLAGAQSSLIAAQERLTAAENDTAGAVARTSAAQKEGAESSRLFGAGMLGGVGGITKMAGELGILFGAFEAVKKVIDITKDAASYQSSMTQIRTLTGASATEVKTMSTALLGLSGNVAQGPADLATSLYHMESVGLKGADALNAVTAAAKGARIGGADLEDTTNALTSTIASGIVKTHNYNKVMSDLLTIVGTGDMKLSDFNDALGSGLLTTVAQFGLSLKDVGAALATFGDNNIRGAHAATTLRMAVQGMADPVSTGVATLSRLGLQANTLATDMGSGGLNKAITDLVMHLKAAGEGGQIDDFNHLLDQMHGKVSRAQIATSSLGETLTDAFGKRAGTGIAVLVGQFDRLQQKYGMLDTGAQTFGERWKAVTKTASFQFDAFGDRVEAAGVRIMTAALPVATKIAGDFSSALGNIMHIVESVGSAFTGAFAVVGGVLEGAGAALKGITSALSFMAPLLRVVATAWAGMWAGQTAARLAVAALTLVTDAVQAVPAKFAAAQASVVSFWTSSAAASTTAAATVADEAALMSGAADVAATDIVASGEVASAGWAGIAGPIGLAAGAILGVITMFHRSTSASKEATDAAKAYSDALSSGGGHTTIVDAIQKQLTDNDLPAELKTVNDALGRTAFTGSQFVNAIERGNPALATLRSRLQDVIAAGTQKVAQGRSYVLELTPAAQAAEKALKSLNAQQSALSKTASKDLLNTKTFEGAASSIDKVAQSSQVASKTAQQYAEMMGIAVDQNGIAAVSSDKLASAVNTMTDAYNDATQSGAAFLGALNTFAQSGGTAADRATLVGSTLVAANGDALSFAGAMNGAASAAAQLAKDVSGKLVASVVNLKTGTINYSKAAAAPLISDLSSMQSAAMNAAEAMYQHAKATEGGRQAAISAYNVYKNQTSGALAGEAKQLGLTTGQAKKLADQYFGMPKSIRTTIAQEGANPVVTVLEKIGQQLSFLTGHRWTSTLNANTSQAMSALQRAKQMLDAIRSKTIAVTVETQAHGSGDSTTVGGHHASGGYISGPGTGTSDSIPAWLSNGEFVVNSSATSKHLGLLRAINSGVRGFASGGPVGGSPGVFDPNPHGNDLFRAVAKALSVFLASAAKSVAAAIAAAVRPAPTSVAGLSGALTRSQGRAVKASQVAAQDRDEYEQYLKHAKAEKAAAEQVTTATNRVAAADQRQANAADKAAAKAQKQADAMKAGTKAEKAAKAAAEGHAKALQKTADAADKAANQAKKSAEAQQAAAERLAAQSSKMADKAKAAWQKAKDAADQAKQAAEAAAQALVASLQSQADALAQAVQGFESTISDGLTQGTDLATVWGQVTQAQSDATDGLTTANQNLADAQQAVADAQQAITDAMPDTSALTAAQNAQAQAQAQFTSAHAQLLAAQAAVAAGQGTPDQYAALTAAQQKQSDTAAALAAANADLATAQQAVSSASGPTQDDLDALTTAQQNLTTATAAATAAQAAQAQANDPAALQDAFDQTLANVQAFASDLTALAADGADQDLISQIAGMGPTSGDALAKQLLAGGSAGIAKLQDTMNQIQTIAGSTSTQLAQGFFGAGVDSMDNLLKGLLKEFPALKAGLEPIIKQLEAMFTITPTVGIPGQTGSGGGLSSGSGSPLSGAGVLPGAGVSVPSSTQTITVAAATTLKALANKYDTTVAIIDSYNKAFAGDPGSTKVAKGTKLTVPYSSGTVSSFASGVQNFGGGLAYVHSDELISMPGGSTVHTATETRNIFDTSAIVAELRDVKDLLTAAPAATGDAVGGATLDGMRKAGREAASYSRRAARRAGAF